MMNDILQAAAPQNRSVRPWIVAYAHRPMWCSNEVWTCATYVMHDVVMHVQFWCPDTDPFKDTWQDIFNQYIDIFIAGHGMMLGLMLDV